MQMMPMVLLVFLHHGSLRLLLPLSLSIIQVFVCNIHGGPISDEAELGVGLGLVKFVILAAYGVLNLLVAEKKVFGHDLVLSAPEDGLVLGCCITAILRVFFVSFCKVESGIVADG